MSEQSRESVTPKLIPIPDGLREFIEVVLILVEHYERGDFQWGDPYCWDEIYWSAGLIFTADNSSYGAHIICYLCEGLEVDFEVRYSPRFAETTTEWVFGLTREELARIADGTVEHLTLYGCLNPLCGYKSSHRQEQCPRCHLASGVEIDKSQSQRVLGICPYCHKPLRSLYAQQCRHCKMDWHDPDHPTKLSTKS